MLQMNGVDAELRGIEAGDRAEMFNDRGKLTLAVQITDKVLPGVVAIAFGWHNDHTVQGRAVNCLTNPATPEDGQGSAAFHDTLVEVERSQSPAAPGDRPEPGRLLGAFDDL